MNILQFCYKPPYPAIDGGTIGMHSISEGLVECGHKVKILTFHSDKNPFDKNLLPQNYIDTYQPESVYVNLKRNVFDALLYVLIARSYVVERFVCDKMKNKLIRILKQQRFDIIQLESIMLAPYIPTIRQFSKAKIMFHCPNVEHLIWERMYQNEKKNIFNRWYLKNTANNLKYYELSHINDFDAVFPVTQKDADYFLGNGLKKPCYSLPIGFEFTEPLNDVMVQKNTLFHIGSMNWFPNQQGIKWFLSEVWDKIIEQSPDTVLNLAGRNMPLWLKNYDKKNVNIIGEVSDSILFMSANEIMVVPLLSGSGIRIKILEAMSIGKPVIATSVAAEGIMYENGKNIVIADTAEEFAVAVKKLTEDSEYCKYIGKNASELIREKYDSVKIAEQLTDYYNSFINS